MFSEILQQLTEGIKEKEVEPSIFMPKSHSTSVSCDLFQSLDLATIIPLSDAFSKQFFHHPNKKDGVRKPRL